jgi:hypothetical protein
MLDIFKMNIMYNDCIMYNNFAMDEPWPLLITNCLLDIPPEGTEKMYYGPYNAILYSAFPPTQRFIVCPQAYPLETRQSMDFTVEYIVQVGKTPVMAVEVKRARVYDTIQARADADDQARERLLSMADTFRVPRFHIVSALGTHCCVYTYNTNMRSITPPRIVPTNLTIVEDLAPAQRWNIDLSTLEGRVELNKYFDDVKAMSSTL